MGLIEPHVQDFGSIALQKGLPSLVYDEIVVVHSHEFCFLNLPQYVLRQFPAWHGNLGQPQEAQFHGLEGARHHVDTVQVSKAIHGSNGHLYGGIRVGHKFGLCHAHETG